MSLVLLLRKSCTEKQENISKVPPMQLFCFTIKIGLNKHSQGRVFFLTDCGVLN